MRKFLAQLSHLPNPYLLKKSIEIYFIVFHSQIALTKKGYSANPVWKPLTDEGHNADEDAAGSPDVKRAPLRSRWYGARSSTNACVKEVYLDKGYMHYECKTYSLLCLGDGNGNGKCEPVYKAIAYVSLNETVTVVSGCRCQ